METKIDYEVCNIVATGNVGFTLNLNHLALKLEKTVYEPERFSGLIYKLVEPKTTFILFKKGKFVCLGAKTNKEIEDSISILFKNLEKFKK